MWRSRPDDVLMDYRMKRVTFGVAASSFAANMSVRQNVTNFAAKYPLAAVVVDKSIYVDDCLTGADTVEEAVSLQVQLQALFGEARFLLRKWSSSDQAALDHVPPDLRESHYSHSIPEPSEYTKTLGLEWNSKDDVFRLTISKPTDVKSWTKRLLTSEVAKTFDVLGWFSPSIIKAKILLQRLWELQVGWDDEVPQEVLSVWHRWRSELPLLADKHLRRCYFPKGVQRVTVELHGFCDASEQAYAAVIYLRTVDAVGDVHVSLVTSKTRVAPLKRLTIPRLELCGADLLAQMLSHVQKVLDVSQVYAWTDSTVVLGWLGSDPRRFKPYVGNRIAHIIEHLPSEKWRHVSGVSNPADCASRGMFPSELLCHDLWWDGPDWLHRDSTTLLQPQGSVPQDCDEEMAVCCEISTLEEDIVQLARYSSFPSFHQQLSFS